MKRLTDKRLAIPPGQWQEVTREKARQLKEIPVPPMRELYCRLSQIEDILGDEYDLDRLRELAEADREGRCVVLPRLEPGQGDDPGPPGILGPPGEVVFCKDCDYLEYSDCYGECGRSYLGIVNPYDYCSRGKQRNKEGKHMTGNEYQRLALRTASSS